jgi:uracil-DNA glycosylase family 4
MQTIRSGLLKYLEIRREFGEDRVYLPDKDFPLNPQDIELDIDKICNSCPSFREGVKPVRETPRGEVVILIVVEYSPSTDKGIDSKGLGSSQEEGLLNKMITAMKLPDEDIFITPAIKCRRSGRLDEGTTLTCTKILEKEIEAISPKYLLLLGELPARMLLGTDAAIGSLRNETMSYKNIPVQVTYSLKNLLNMDRLKRNAWDDLKKVISWYDKHYRS